MFFGQHSGQSVSQETIDQISGNGAHLSDMPQKFRVEANDRLHISFLLVLK